MDTDTVWRYSFEGHINKLQQGHKQQSQRSVLMNDIASSVPFISRSLVY